MTYSLLNVVRRPNSIGFPRAFNAEIDHWFDDLINPSFSSKLEFAPAVEIKESENHYLISFDVPGVAKNDVSIDVEGQELRVSGERKGENTVEKDEYHFSERAVGKFERRFRLPEHLDLESIEAVHRDGVLKIVLPKSQTARPRRIDIKEESSGFFKNLLGKSKEEKLAG